jgi:hypothetical protein
MLILSPAAVAQGATGDLDCADFDTREQAQAALDAGPGDPNGLDADGDGLACESLPGGAAEDGTMMGGGSTGGEPADLDCIDFATQAEAQAAYAADPSDPNGLDADNDGVACETTVSTPDTTEFEDGSGVASGGPLLTEDDATDEQYADTNDTGDTGDGSANVTSLPETGGPALLPVVALVMGLLMGLAVLRRGR